MSRTIQTATALAAFLATFSAHAASINVVQSPTASGVGYSIYLDDEGIGNYNTVDVLILPNAPAQFLNYNPTGTQGTTILRAGANATFTNAFLTFPFIEFGSSGFPWSVVGGNDSTLEISHAMGPLGRYIDLSGLTPLFLENVVLPVGASGHATITLMDTGISVFSQTVRLGVPEPGSLILGPLSFVGCAVIRRFYY